MKDAHDVVSRLTHTLSIGVACAMVLVAACGAPTSHVAVTLPQQPAATCKVSEATARIVRSLHHPLVIEAYVTQETPKGKAFAGKLETFLKAFAAASSNVIVRVVDPRTKEERDGAEKLGLKEMTDGDKPLGYSGLVFAYGTEHDIIPVLVPDNNFGLEYWVTNKIRQLEDKVEGVHHRIGQLVGHGEMSLGEANLVPAKMGSPSMREVITRNFPYFELVDVDLHGGSTAVDDTLEGLLITQPARDLTEHELHVIDDFVLRGKALVVFASAVNVSPSDPSMLATLSTHNLERLLDGYGIEMHQDVVLDYGRAYKIEMATVGGTATVRFPQLIEVIDDEALHGDARAIDTTFPVFFRMEQIILPFASSLTLRHDKQPTAAMKVVARSTPHSIRDTHDPVNLGLHAWKPKGEWKQFDLAAYVEGRLHSAFTEAVAAGTARVFVLASSQLTANPFARAGNPGPGRPDGDESTLQIAGPYADLQRGAVPLLYSIMATLNALDMIVNGPELSALTEQTPCAPVSR